MTTVRMPSKDNSDRARREAAQVSQVNAVQPITKGKMRDKNLAMKFADVFFEGDLKSAVHYMIYDAAIPQIKNMLLKSLEIILLGKTGGNAYSGSASSYYSGQPYGSYYIQRNGERRDASSGGASSKPMVKVKKNFDPRLIVVEDRGMAERVLEELRLECNSEYGQVPVQKLFSLVGIDSDWSTTSYGWRKGSLDYPRSSVKGCSDGWCFELPEPVPID